MFPTNRDADGIFSLDSIIVSNIDTYGCTGIVGHYGSGKEGGFVNNAVRHSLHALR